MGRRKKCDILNETTAEKPAEKKTRKSVTPEKYGTYINKIDPLVQEIKATCNRYQIPCYMTFAIGTDDNRFIMKSTSLVPELFGMDTTGDKRFADFVNIQNGFLAVPANEHPELLGVSDAIALESASDEGIEED